MASQLSWNQTSAPGSGGYRWMRSTVWTCSSRRAPTKIMLMLKVPDRGADLNKVVLEVVLVKKTDLNGSFQVGRLYHWTYKPLPRHIAIHKAFDALVREHPDEARVDWRVSE